MKRHPVETLAQIVKDALIARGMTPGEASCAIEKLTNGKITIVPKNNPVYEHLTEQRRIIEENYSLSVENFNLKAVNKELTESLEVYRRMEKYLYDACEEMRQKAFNPHGKTYFIIDDLEGGEEDAES